MRLEDRFWQRVRKTTGCWLWTGTTFTTHGITYGQWTISKAGGKRVRELAHVFSYCLHYGPVPDGCVVDHLCRNGLCVRPDHLEAVPNRTNILRGEGVCAINARKTHCKRNHPLTPENLIQRSDGRRDCKLCDRERRALTRK